MEMQCTVCEKIKVTQKRRNFNNVSALIDASTLNTYVLTYDLMKYEIAKKNELMYDDYCRLMTQFFLNQPT